MYQTVGHQAVDLIAEAMGLPLYRRTIEGSSVHIDREYSPTDGDEVEDLYQLLKHVKEEMHVDGVSVGAILSDYQRVRVENVCARLQLQPLAYLWRRDQAALLSEMISSGLHAILIKVAAFGLHPDKHLGKSLAEMELYLHELSEKYGVHICGEGGEYETFTLDCPLFKKKIIIDATETVIHSDDAFAPVGFLRFTKMHTEDKTEGSGGPPPPSLSACPCQSAIDRMTEELEYADKTADVQRECPSHTQSTWQLDEGCEVSHSSSSSGFQWISGLSALPSEHPDIQSQAQHVFTLLQSRLQEMGSALRHVLLVHLYVSSMQDFGLINSIYSRLFTHNPPARVCVQASLPVGQQLQMDVLLQDQTKASPSSSSSVCEEECFPQRETLHVQSVSHWAPANIGPYSQATQVGGAVFCAGQIPLVPCRMVLLDGPPLLQAQLCFSHTEKVLEAVSSGLTLKNVLQAHIYITDVKYSSAVSAAWRTRLQDAQLHLLVVCALPRGALLELHVSAVQDCPSERVCVCGSSSGLVESRLLRSGCARYASLSLSVCESAESVCVSAESLLHTLMSCYSSALQESPGLTALCARVFYRRHHNTSTHIATGLQQRFTGARDPCAPAVVLVPVEDLAEGQLLLVSCWLSV
ncbi:diphthine--ammonia ligase isoform X2 [Danio rerio]